MKKILALLIISSFILNSCCDEDFTIPDYDFQEYALDVTSLIGTCSADEAYTTVGATPDLNGGSCWGASPTARHNRWFKFTATGSNIWVTVNVGTQLRSYMALWDTDGTTELGCAFYDNDNGSISVTEIGSLTAGEVYYFSVDVADDAGAGTFTLCIQDAF